MGETLGENEDILVKILHLELQTLLCGSIYNSHLQGVGHWSASFPISSGQSELWSLGLVGGSTALPHPTQESGLAKKQFCLTFPRSWICDDLGC